MAWQKACSLTELKAKKKLRVVVEDNALLVVLVNEKPHIIADKCPHMGASLHKGTLEDDHVVCPAHGAKINVTNGSIARKAKILFVKMPTKKAQTYEAKIDGDGILVNL